MAGYGYGGFGPYGGIGGYGGGTIRQEFEQERIGFGPQGYGVYEQEMDINRNPYTGATSVIQENEFMPMRGGVGYGGYGGGYGYRFF